MSFNFIYLIICVVMVFGVFPLAQWKMMNGKA